MRDLALAGSLAMVAPVAAASVDAAAAGATRTASFNVTAVQASPGAQVTVNSQVWITPTHARADVKDPLRGEMTVLVTDGYLYQLDPKAKKGVKQPLPPEMKKSKDNFDFLISSLTFNAAHALQSAKKVRTESVSGYDCDVFVVSQTKEGDSHTTTVWVPQKMTPKFPIKAVTENKITKPGASLEDTTTITLSNIKTGIDIPATTWKVPSGMEIKTLSQSKAPRLAPKK